jgi:hypothetical protein
MRLRNAVLAAAIVFVFGGTAIAQRITGSIDGRVLDPSGAVLPGVEITVTNDATQQARTAITNETGLYNVPLLPSGTYSVRASLPGFRTEVRRGVQVEVDRNARVDVQLEVGNVTESLEVTADAPLIVTDNAALGQVIDSRRVAELPLNGREFLALASLAPGVQPNVEGSNLSTQSGSVNVNGAREEFNLFLLDGVDNNDTGNSQLIIVPGIDSIQEFKVQTSAYSAEYGRSAGGLVNVSTKSGTNELHGTIYGFLRHSSMDARNFFNTKPNPKQPFQRNQWGGTLGGPVVTNKTFIFGSYERTDIKQTQTALAQVPPAEWRNGDFSTLATPIVDPMTGQQFPGNRIPAGRISALGKAFLDRFPLPNASGPNNLVGASLLTSYVDNVSLRGDHQFSQDDTLFVRYSFWKQKRLEPFSRSATTIPGYGILLDTTSQSLTINETHIFSSNLVNEVRLGFTRLVGGLYSELAPEAEAVTKQLGLKGVRQTDNPTSVNPNLYDVPRITAVGYSGLVGGNPHVRYDNHFTYTDNLAYTHGVHKLKMGFESKRNRPNLFLTGLVAGQFDFQGRYTGNSIADMLLGFPITTSREIGDVADYERSWHLSWYMQDDWRISDRLTLNLGLRYEIQTSGFERFDRKGSFSVARGVQVLGGKSPLPADAAALMARFPGLAVKDPDAPRNGYDTDYNDIAPRVGFAFDVAGDGKTVIRGGTGIFYVPIILNKTHAYKRAFPWVLGETAVANTDPRNPNLSLADPFPAGLISGSISAAAIAPDYRQSYMEQWNLNIQRELGGATVVEVGYAGSKGNALHRGRNVNQAVLGPGNVTQRRPFPRFGNISMGESSANSNYHSLQMRFDRRLTGGFSALTSYTWSKSIDDNSGSGGLGESGSAQNNYDLAAERGPSVFDRTHRLTVGYLLEVPGGKNLNGAARLFLSGWQTNGIFSISTGQPVTPGLQGDRSLTLNNQDRPNVIGDTKLDTPSPSGWWNKPAFEVPALGNYGNAGRNSLRGPGLVNMDFSLFKNFPYRENVEFFQFRTEIFNLTNHPQFLLPNRNVNNVAFGTVSRARDARQIQLSLRMSF